MADDPVSGIGPGPFSAVIFDLFGTLVRELPAAVFYGVVDEMAGALGADREAWRIEWDETASARQTGGFETIEANVRAICGRLDISASDADVDQALERRRAMYDEWFRPREGAVETVREMRERGMRLGLVSMCAPDTPEMWRTGELAGTVDVEIFSVEVGLRKPDPAIYRLACERLGVGATTCLYCGDGAYGELTGAEAVGMTAVLIRDPSVDQTLQLTPDRDPWERRVITDLRELLAWVPPRS